MVVEAKKHADASITVLPHLRARSTIHADLLRPVRLNRAQTGHLGGPPPAPIGKKRRKHRQKDTADSDGGSHILQRDLEKSEHGNANTRAGSWNNRLQESRRRCRKRNPRKRLGTSYTGQDREQRDRHGERVFHAESGRAPCIARVRHQHSPDDEGTITFARSYSLDPVECQTTEKHSPNLSTWGGKDIGGRCSHLSQKIFERPQHSELSLSNDTPTDLSQVGCSVDYFSKDKEPRMLASVEEIAVVTRILGKGYEAGCGFGRDDPYAIPNTVSSAVANDRKRRTDLIRFRPVVREELRQRGTARSGQLNRQDSPSRRTQHDHKTNRRRAKFGDGKHVEPNNRGIGYLVQGDRQQDYPRVITQQAKDRPRTGSHKTIIESVVAEREMASNNTTASQAVLEQEGRDGPHRLSSEPQLVPPATRRSPSPSETCASEPTESSSFAGETLNDETDSQNKGKCCSQQTITASPGTPSFPSHPLPPPPSCPTLHHVANCMCELCRRARAKRKPGPPARPTFKIVGSEPRLVSATLEAHGFKKEEGKYGVGGRRGRGAGAAPWRILWSSQHLRRETLAKLP